MRTRYLVIWSLLLLFLAASCTSLSKLPEIDVESNARIEELEAALADAERKGGLSEEAIAEIQFELDELGDEAGTLQEELSAARQDQCSYNAYQSGWVMDWADAGNIVDTVFGPTSNFQSSFWQVAYPDQAAEFAALVTAAYRNTDLESRAASWQVAEKIIVEDLATVVPLHHFALAGLISTDVNYFFPPFGAARFAGWSFSSGKTTLRTPIGSAVPTLDMQRGTDTTSFLVIAQLIDAPFRFNEEGSIEPLAATGFDVSDEGTIYTIHFRENAVWSDGVPVTAQHYLDGITRLLSPDLANDYAYVMMDIVGAAEYNAGKIDTLDSVVAVDDKTLEITLSQPLSYFDSILAFSTLDPVRLDIIEKYGEEWTRPGNYVSNGAYVLVEHRPGEIVVMEKNPLYWDAENVQIERIEIPIITESVTRLAAFELGDLDMLGAGGIPSEDLPRLVKTPEFVRGPRPGTYYITLNTVGVHTNNLNFRKALASSINKRIILDEVMNIPWPDVAYGVIPPEIYGHQGDKVGYGFDPDVARSYLNAYMQEASIDEAGDIVVELWFTKGNYNQQYLEAVEVMWEENLGVDVRTVNMEFATYITVLNECNSMGAGGF